MSNRTAKNIMIGEDRTDDIPQRKLTQKQINKVINDWKIIIHRKNKILESQDVVAQNGYTGYR